jgi:Tol biopolymer transport system component
MNLEVNAFAPEGKFSIKRIIFLLLALFLLNGFSAGIVRAENGKIAYAYANAIYKMNPDGTNPQQLTAFTDLGYHREYSPVWSPDGTKIAFVRYTSNHSNEGGGGLNGDTYNTVDVYNIYTIDYNGGNLTLIKTSSDFLNDLAWSPDGTKLAYVQGGDTTYAGIYQTCGGNTYIYTIDAVAGGSSVRLGATAGGIDPSWSRDGTEIFYAVNTNSENFGIYSVNLSTEEVQRLTYDNYAPADPEISPDGSKIAYAVDYPQEQCLFGNMSTMGPTRTQIYTGSLIVYNISQNNSVILTNKASSPVWHPSGNLILFISSGSNGEWSEQLGEPELATITAAGTNLTVIQSNQFGVLSGSWSP